MNEFVIPLTNINLKDVSLVGNKAATLGALLEAGFPTLQGICITTSAFQLALDPHREPINTLLQTLESKNPTNAVSVSERIIMMLDQLKIPEPVEAELNDLLPSIADPSTPLAIRSSATAEDTYEASFAGHYRSVIGVTGNSSIRKAILDVWRSFFNPEALMARANFEGFDQKASMGVLLLPVVNAECSGVALSVDPVQNDGNRVIVTATWGLGMGVVDGSAAADTAWIRRDGVTDGFEIEEHRVVEKTNHFKLNASGELVKEPVDSKHQQISCLPDSWLIRVAQFCVAVEVLFGSPQDMEWAISNGDIVILQSRPITALTETLNQPNHFPVNWENPEEQHNVWIYYPYWRYVLKPLEVDYAFDRASASKEASHFVGGERSWSIKIVNGRAFMAWLPVGIPIGHRRIHQMALRDLHKRLHQQKMTTWEYWGPEIERATQRLKEFEPETASGHQIADHLENARGTFHRHWSMHGSRLWISRQPFYDAFAAIKSLPFTTVREAANHLLEGEDNPSTKLIDWLYDLALIARKNSEVASLVSKPSKDVLMELAKIPEAREFLGKYDLFMCEYGACSGLGYGSDATIISPTWQEQPGLVLRLIATYLSPEVESPKVIRSQAQRKRKDQIREILESCTNQTLVKAFKQEFEFARRQAAIMEIHNYFIDQMMNGQLRHAILYAADRLVKQGSLTIQDDIFWLHYDEITAALRSEKLITFTEEIANRREQHIEWEKYTPPPLIGIPNANLPKRPEIQLKVTQDLFFSSSQIRGVGASPGSYRGRARIIDNSILIPDISPGEILITQNIGPRWTPIFPILGGIILDGGSVGQHHAIVAREYGIPAVVGTGNATLRVPEGAWVTLDGTTGLITIE